MLYLMISLNYSITLPIHSCLQFLQVCYKVILLHLPAIISFIIGTKVMILPSKLQYSLVVKVKLKAKIQKTVVVKELMTSSQVQMQIRVAHITGRYLPFSITLNMMLTNLTAAKIRVTKSKVNPNHLPCLDQLSHLTPGQNNTAAKQLLTYLHFLMKEMFKLARIQRHTLTQVS